MRLLLYTICYQVIISLSWGGCPASNVLNLASNGVDTTADGSVQKPYQTLDYAITQVSQCYINSVDPHPTTYNLYLGQNSYNIKTTTFVTQAANLTLIQQLANGLTSSQVNITFDNNTVIPQGFTVQFSNTTMNLNNQVLNITGGSTLQTWGGQINTYGINYLNLVNGNLLMTETAVTNYTTPSDPNAVNFNIVTAGNCFLDITNCMAGSISVQ